MHVLRCPNCGANLEVEDGIDTFYCKYCGYKIILEGQSDQAYRSKTQMKKMAHDERMMDKHIDYKKYKLNQKHEDKKQENKRKIAIIVGWLIIVALGIFYLTGPVRWKSDKEEQKLQTVVEEVQKDIKNEDFNDAYIKAQSVVYTSGYSNDTEEKWNNTRKELINQIIDAEKQATGSSTHKPEK